MDIRQFVSLTARIAVILILVLATTHPAMADGPIDWSQFTGFFTGFQGAIMVIAAVLCVFCIIGGLISVGAQGGVHGVAIGFFVVALLCVFVLAAPAIVHWIQGFVGTTA